MQSERNTKQKQTIYDALTALNHPSATEVYEYLHGQKVPVSRGTVFRVLGSFSDGGKVSRFTLSDGEAHYDCQTFPHAHARCRRCNRIYDVLLPQNVRWEAVTAEGFFIDGCLMEFTGVCRACAQEPPEQI